MNDTIDQIRTIFGAILKNGTKDRLDAADEILLARIKRSQRAIEASVRERALQKGKAA